MTQRAVPPIVFPNEAPVDRWGPHVPFTAGTRDEEARAALQRRPSRQEIDDAAQSLREITRPHRAGVPLLGLFGGLTIGALVGLMAGAPGVVIGGLLGLFIGFAAGFIYQELQLDREQRDSHLDRVIGVTEGNLGEGLVNAPPARLGCFGAASVGAANALEDERSSAHGPLSNNSEDSLSTM